MIRKQDEERFLGMVAFLSGAVLMGFEVLGFRVMAVAFGSRDVVNGSLITAILAAMSIGTALGGRLADRRPDPRFIGAALLLTGLSIGSVPWLSRALSGTALSDPAVTGLWGPLLGALLLFAPASFVLGIITPFIVRVLGPSRQRLGRVTGRIFALSSAGSVCGTLGTTFVLMPAEWLGGHSNALRLLGGLTLVLGLAVLLRGAGAGGKRMARLSLLFLLLWNAGTAVRAETVIYERDSTYSHIQVVDETVKGVKFRLLKLDGTNQSAICLTAPQITVWSYTDYAHLALLFQPKPVRTLFVGLGAGVMPTRFREDYPQVRSETVELDPAVIAVARKYFSLTEDDRLRVTEGDGRQFLTRSKDHYDLIGVDAYRGDRGGPTLPFTFCTKEFFTTVRERLAPGGVMAFNLIGKLEGKSYFTLSILKTMQSVFPQVYLFIVERDTVPDMAVSHNIMVIGTLDQKRVPPAVLKKRASDLVMTGTVKMKKFIRYSENLYTGKLDLSKARVLTDDFAQPDLMLRQ